MSLDPIVAQTHVPVPPTPAFTGFTAQMGEWWDPLITEEPSTFTSVDIDPGGEVAMVHGDDHLVWGRVTTWSPTSELVLECWLGHAPGSSTTVRVTFTDEDEGTRVRVEHSGWADDAGEVRARFEQWDRLLERYAAHVG